MPPSKPLSMGIAPPKGKNVEKKRKRSSNTVSPSVKKTKGNDGLAKERLDTQKAYLQLSRLSLADTSLPFHVHEDSKQDESTQLASTEKIIDNPADTLEPPPTLAALGLSEEQWEDLEASQEALPRFLFRGFSPSSGGDSRLNTTTRIIPHAFIGGKQPTSIYDIPQLKRNIDDHVCGRIGNSEFSSWTSWLAKAMHYARRSQRSYVAMIDRKLMPNVKIYHVPDLYNAELVTIKKDWEYLVYGPVSGPGLYCVAYTDIMNAGYRLLAGVSRDGTFLKTLAFESVRAKVGVAKNLARMFCDKYPDVVVALTAAFCCEDLCDTQNRASERSNKKLIRELIACLGDELKSLSKEVDLVNPKMYVGPYPQLKQLVVRLQNIEGWIKARDANLQ
ncbi:hypothetical protein F5Y04DRAFT_283361 [Hypomontagnella monticulosa]|nr:hypothetical protein F5Y04DRAFT_283361 [Hypomontagnella monticulosa]